jgi:hypothetical protein
VHVRYTVVTFPTGADSIGRIVPPLHYLMSLFERVDLSSPVFIGLSSVVAYSLYLLLGFAFQSPALNALPGPAFEGLALVAPFKGEATTRMMELIAQYGTVFSFKRRFSVRINIHPSLN